MSETTTSAAVVPADASHAAAWRVGGVVIVASLMILGAVYWETVVWSVFIWGDSDTYGHGYLLLPISLYLVWRARAELARLPPRPDPWGIPVIVGAALLWAIADVVAAQVVKELSLLVLIGAFIWTILGRRVARLLAFPVGYLVLGIPIWSLLIPTLQTWTAEASTGTLQFWGVPVFLEGYYMSIPAGNFVVAEVCAGLRFLLAAVSITALYAYLNIRSVFWGAALVVAAIVFNVVFNWIRVVVIVGAGHFGGMDHWLVTNHIAFGWVIFGLGLVPVFWLGIWLERLAARHGDGAARPRPRAVVSEFRSAKLVTLGVTVLLLSAIGPGLVGWIEAAQPATGTVRLGAIEGRGGWSGPLPARTDWRPIFDGARAESLQDYEKDGRRVSLYIAYYDVQRQGAELIGYSNSLYGKGEWGLAVDRRIPMTAADGEKRLSRETVAQSSAGESRQVRYFYFVGGQTATSDVAAKLLEAWGAVSRRPGAAVVAVVADDRNRENARRILDDFAEQMVSGILAVLRDPVVDGAGGA